LIRFISTAREAAEKLGLSSVLKGHGFSGADKANQMSRALAPEGCFSRNRATDGPFSAATKAMPYYKSIRVEFFRSL
jgi:hypothetical protein